jgi:hypothetical protein
MHTSDKPIVRRYHTEEFGLVRRHADGVYDFEKECEWYNPCELCYRCKDAAPNLYAKCTDCPAQGCNHSVNDRNLMINRDM